MMMPLLRRAAARVVAVAALLTATRASAGAVCFPSPFDTTCLSWVTDGKNITFKAVWPPAQTSAVGWGAWGISAISCGSMFPSSIAFGVKGPGGIAVEDRVAVAHVVPACRKRSAQLSHVTKSSTQPDGTWSVTWTRPLVAPPSSGQPSIVPGNVSLIGAMFFGPLDLRPCETVGVPGHSAFTFSTVQLVSTADALGASSGLASTPASSPVSAAPEPVSGLVSAFTVCAGSELPFSSLVKLSPLSGAEAYYGVPSNTTLYPGLTTVDPVGRRVFSIYPGGTVFVISSTDVDTGAPGVVCTTPFPVPSAISEFSNLNIAWDARNGTVIFTCCTDAECAGYVQVTRLNPTTCELHAVVKVPTDPVDSVSMGAGAFDPSTNTFVMTVSQVHAQVGGPVLVTVNMLTGAVKHSLVEAGAYNLVSFGTGGGGRGTGAGPGKFYALNRNANASVSLAVFDSARNTVELRPAVVGCYNPIPGLLAVKAGKTVDDTVVYLVTADGVTGGPRLIGVHAGNGTLASAALLPGDSSGTPLLLLHLD